MAEKGWTVEQAKAAQQAFEAKHPGEPRGPLFQWSTLHELGELENKFHAGDRDAVLHAVYLCALDDLVMPEWVSKAFRRQYIRGLHGHLRSWHDVFGRPRTKGQVRRFMRDAELPYVVREMIAEEKFNRQPIGDAMFERIGKKLGTNRQKVADAYRAFRRLTGRP